MLNEVEIFVLPFDGVQERLELQGSALWIFGKELVDPVFFIGPGRVPFDTF
jgi:hypothetical protein